MTDKRRSGFAQGESDAESQKGEISTVLKNHFSPEFLNRLDEVIIFNKLNISDAETITKGLLESVRLSAADIGIRLDYDRDASRRLTELGYNRAYGARPLKRTVTAYIENPLADEILKGNIRSGDTVMVSFDTEARFTVV